MKHTVLIVEDEIFVATDIERILEDAGYFVSAIAADKKSALAAAPGNHIALVDLNLRDGLTGPEIACQIAKQHGIKVIYVTANPAQINPRAENAIGYIRKPFDDKSNLNAVHHAAGACGKDELTNITLF
jgi:CheY-like chemotaxis protein